LRDEGREVDGDLIDEASTKLDAPRAHRVRLDGRAEFGAALE
jgi:hypothetical protein